jgi:Ca2+-binding EF-hand superfamily protein
MRSKLVPLSGLTGCLVLILVPATGRVQPPATRPGSFSSAGVDDRFRKLDRNGDGTLGYEELSDNLKVEKGTWDADSDGRIDLAEWRAYAKAYIAQKRSAPKPGVRPDEMSRGPNAARPPARGEGPKTKTAPVNHKLPGNCPAWFRQYDDDVDGQVALYEWKEKNEDLSEFRKWDTSDDGFITLRELLRSGYFASDSDNTPRTVRSLRAEPGEFFYFEVTGAVSRKIWGTDVYTDRSSIATAAVHAGVLKVGQTRLIKVTILEGGEAYEGSVRNGVRTRSHGAVAQGFKVETAP